MSTLDFTREQLAQYILTKAKESSLSKIRSIILNEGEEDISTFDLNEKQLSEIDNRRERFLAGEGKSYSWQEVKQELIEKHGLQA